MEFDLVRFVKDNLVAFLIAFAAFWLAGNYAPGFTANYGIIPLAVAVIAFLIARAIIRRK